MVEIDKDFGKVLEKILAGENNLAIKDGESPEERKVFNVVSEQRCGRVACVLRNVRHYRNSKQRWNRGDAEKSFFNAISYFLSIVIFRALLLTNLLKFLKLFQWDSLYDHIRSIDTDVSPITFRIFHASILLEEKLQEGLIGPLNLKRARKIYTDAFKSVQQLLNHKTVQASRNYTDPRIIAELCKRSGVNVKAVRNDGGRS